VELKITLEGITFSFEKTLLKMIKFNIDILSLIKKLKTKGIQIG
jgi:hypothetical protein